jgi:hypothetical protein
VSNLTPQGDFVFVLVLFGMCAASSLIRWAIRRNLFIRFWRWVMDIDRPEETEEEWSDRQW